MSAPTGLDLFQAAFASYADQYVLIGGTATHLTMAAAGLAFRNTRDLDIVLIVEALTPEFARAFWAFIGAGAYGSMEKGGEARQFYRFTKPATSGYPAMLELFSRVPDGLQFEPGGQLTPIPFGDEAESLSAILLDDHYYHLIREGARQQDGLAWVDEQVLIPLKARAWLDLRQRKAAGPGVDEKTVRKHLNDVLRLTRVLTEESRVTLPPSIHADLMTFIGAARQEVVDLKSLGFRAGTSLDNIVDQLIQAFPIQRPA
ncbi:MAG: hypothetical protein V4857_20115 [Pseudomonadota bacterium]